LRFLATIAVGWVAVRVLLLWSETSAFPEAIRRTIPLAAAAAVPAGNPMLEPSGSQARGDSGIPATPEARGRAAALAAAAAPAPTATARRGVRDPVRVQFAWLGLIQYGAPVPLETAAARVPLPQEAGFPLAPTRGRWSGTAWLVARGGAGLGTAPGGGQLGGGQAGTRLAYILAPRARLAAVARVTTPLEGPGREAAFGVEWQPGDLPVRLVAEHRFPLDAGGAGGPVLGLIAGTDRHVGPGFRLEAYGQAGAVARTRIEPYADGAVRITRGIARRKRFRLALGGGVWGAAQNDAARLDLGPSAVLGVDTGGSPMRVALDWRQRVAGDAQPGSGATLTLAADF